MSTRNTQHRQDRLASGPRAWVRTITTDEATGPLKRLYESAIERAGKVFNVIRVQGLQPRTMAASTRLYQEVMFSDTSELTRAQREMLAVVVSRANDCHY